MLIAALTFALVLAIVFGMYWAFVLREEQAAHAAIQARLKTPRPVARVYAGLQLEAERLSQVPAFHRLLAGREDVAGPLRRLIAQSGVKTTAGVVVLSSGCLLMAGVAGGNILAHSLLLGLIPGVCAAVLPIVYLRWKRTQRLQKFEELLPEALDLMTRAMRAGHGLPTAIGMVADELPDPVASEFRLLHDRQVFGLPLEDALRDFGQRIPLLSVRFLVTSVLTQREAGGNLTEVLDNLSWVIRDRFSFSRQIRAKSAHGRMSGWVLTAMPPVVGLSIAFLNPRAWRLMLEDPLGVQMVIGAVVLQVIGFLIIRKIVNIEY